MGGFPTATCFNGGNPRKAVARLERTGVGVLAYLGRQGFFRPHSRSVSAGEGAL
ncbi:hypothetical protein H6G76_06760 [Nostoc sp. FACHB-152]|uniref:hypothetical protein n=1 Tax=Nostoc sp. FACHB-145 TaxID=2692836 RepID=UPI0016832350|nr:hypothetical protein [Nostoc sp. FACHB-145]MBD2446869.1 hypothetical protein [Nostoc sp. FACHB-152]MBD2467794.1 hypothetical protein [Nostoc sp. FACHB-145]